ncbi:CGNR zinc finger domain-containing protein [Arsenicicoccus dermatophilus]|uniref:CGNR zinc finger domain-containing protein n=1 Tax=Arsenicicoccus dermatophilus TaxID=1076331 RepID=UPI003916DA46
MTFAHDTREGLLSTAALVNTGVAPATLSTTEDLDAFVERFGYTGRRTHDQAELKKVVALRTELHRLWELDEEGTVELVNSLLSRYQAQPRLVRHEGWWDWHLHATSQDAPLADRMAVEAAMSMVDVIRSGELDRLRICEAEDCDGVIVDLSKNRSRRYCERGCGNRMAVQAYRERRRT